MEDGDLVFIATPAMGHLVALMELAKNLVVHHPHISISISIVVLKLPISDPNLDSYLRSAIPISGTSRISLLELPQLENPPKPEQLSSKRPFFVTNLFADLYKPVLKRLLENRPRRIIGILTDMVIAQFADVAEELGVPSYVLFTSGANMLAMMLQLESLGLQPESAPIDVPGFRNPIPLNVWPQIFFSEENSARFLSNASRYRKMKGILLNTFEELEPEILLSLSGDHRIPPVYAVGPVLSLSRQMVRDSEVMNWLDAQPPASVVFLCFGSHGSFTKEQIEQIAVGVERSGQRFVWSLRREPDSEKGEYLPSEFTDFEKVLPAGFLDRTAGTGKMIGWAPQEEILGHPAVGAFVSHCGWNSVLESLWFGVPIVTWPMYAEQQLNAFCMVRELGIATEIRMDYMYDVEKKKANMVVNAADVENGIRKMMEEEEGVAARIRVKKMRQYANNAMEVQGSSYKSLCLFTQDLIKNASTK